MSSSIIYIDDEIIPPNHPICFRYHGIQRSTQYLYSTSSLFKIHAKMTAMKSLKSSKLFSSLIEIETLLFNKNGCNNNLNASNLGVLHNCCETGRPLKLLRSIAMLFSLQLDCNRTVTVSDQSHTSRVA